MKMLRNAVLAVLSAAPYANGVSVRGASLLPDEANAMVFEAPRDLSATDLDESQTALLRGGHANPAVANFQSIRAILNNVMKPKVQDIQVSLQKQLDQQRLGILNCMSWATDTQRKAAMSIGPDLERRSKDHATCRRVEASAYNDGLDCYNELQRLEEAGRETAADKLKAQQRTCNEKKARHESMRTSCDMMQRNLDALFCRFYDWRSLACKNDNTCIDAAAPAFNKVIARVRNLDSSMMTLFNSILHMECLITAFSDTDEDRATRACHPMNYVTRSAHLVLSYPQLPVRTPCPGRPYIPEPAIRSPGSSAILPNDAPPATCNASCCEPSTRVRPTLARVPVTTTTRTTTKGWLVTCSLTVKDALISVFYNGVNLTSQVTLQSSLRSWEAWKRVSFHYVSGAYLVITGHVYHVRPGLSCDEAFLAIKCSDPASNANFGPNWEAVKGTGASDPRQDGTGNGWEKPCRSRANALQVLSDNGDRYYASIWGNASFSIMRFRTP